VDYAKAKVCRVRQLSPMLGCDVLAVYGYRAESPTWRGPFRRSYWQAKLDAIERNHEMRRQPRVNA
jgi:hypothetical protein